MTFAFSNTIRKQPAPDDVSVDRRAGTIRNLVVITAGVTDHSGGGRAPMVVDSLTLRQVAESINRQGGVKCRLTHPELQGTDDLPFRLGYMRNARVNGAHVLADFTAHTPTDPHVLKLTAIADVDPASCGLSIVADEAEALFQNQGQSAALRIARVSAVDFVGKPASNPRGMFAASASAYTDGESRDLFDGRAAYRPANIEDTSMTMLSAPDRSYFATRTGSLVRETQDALLIKMGCPLVEFGDDGKPVIMSTGKPVYRKPSHTSVALAGDTLMSVSTRFLRLCGAPAHLMEQADASPYAWAKTLLSRSTLSNYFRHLSPSDRTLYLSTSTGDIPNLIGDTIRRAILTHFALGRRSWRTWARQAQASNYRVVDVARFEDLENLPETGELEQIPAEGIIQTDKEQIAVKRYARILPFSRELFINDDVRLIGTLTQAMAAAAHRLEDVLAYQVLTANGAMADTYDLFSTEHGNTSTGALSTTSLGTLLAKLAAQTNAAGNVLDLQGAALIVPATLKSKAEETLHAMSGAKRGIGESELSIVSSGHLDATSTTAFYTAADPARMAAVELTFITGQTDPQIAESMDFDTDGLMVRVSHSLTANAVDYRAIARSSGS